MIQAPPWSGRHSEVPYTHTGFGHFYARTRPNRDGDTVTTIDPAEYFFRFESNTWLVADWELVKAQLLDVDETTESAVEQLALDFIKNHGESTSDAARVLVTAYEVYAFLFRDEHLAGLDLPRITADHR